MKTDISKTLKYYGIWFLKKSRKEKLVSSMSYRADARHKTDHDINAGRDYKLTPEVFDKIWQKHSIWFVCYEK